MNEDNEKSSGKKLKGKSNSFVNPKLKFAIQLILFIALHIFVSIFLSFSVFKLMNLDMKETQINQALDKVAYYYNAFAEDETVLRESEPFFGKNSEYSSQLYAFDNSRREILDQETPFNRDNVFGNSGHFSEGMYTYYFNYYIDIRLYLVLQVPKAFITHVEPDVISGIILLNIVLLAIFYVFFLFLKNIYYNPVISFEKSIEEIIEDGYNPRVGFDTMIKMHPLSHKFEKLIILLRELLEKEYNETILRKQAELNALQGQINPHFLYNTLNTIRGQALWEGMDSIAEMTQALARCLRYSINMNNQMVTLAEELDNIKYYFHIQQTRFGDKLEFEIEVEDYRNGNIYDFKIPKLTIQPIVENAVFHGLEQRVGMGKVIIKAFATDTRLAINIIDNGVGIERKRLNHLNKNLYLGTNAKLEDNEDRGSIGLYNVNQRIKLYYGEEFGLRIQSIVGVKTNVEIIVPIIR